MQTCSIGSWKRFLSLSHPTPARHAPYLLAFSGLAPCRRPSAPLCPCGEACHRLLYPVPCSTHGRVRTILRLLCSAACTARLALACGLRKIVLFPVFSDFLVRRYNGGRSSSALHRGPDFSDFQPQHSVRIVFKCASLTQRCVARYEGTLYTIDPKEATVALQNGERPSGERDGCVPVPHCAYVVLSVRCFGTENRSETHVVEPSPDIYEFIIFRGKDIKDLHVCERPTAPAQVKKPLQDPAIVSTTMVRDPPARFMLCIALTARGAAASAVGSVVGPFARSAARRWSGRGRRCGCQRWFSVGELWPGSSTQSAQLVRASGHQVQVLGRRGREVGRVAT